MDVLDKRKSAFKCFRGLIETVLVGSKSFAVKLNLFLERFGPVINLFWTLSKETNEI
jgi:hypothetical protein